LKRFLLYQFPALAWLILIFWLSSFGTLPNIQVFQWQDKVEHAAAFFVLCFFTRRAFAFQNALPALRRRAMRYAVAVACVYGVLDEVHQLYVPGRNFDYWDMAADAAGAGICALALFLYRRMRERRIGSHLDPMNEY
jgi:VanZ family protein